MEFKKILNNCRGKTVLVIGDIICDRYIFSRPGRLSREAPVMILDYEGERIVPGGGANVALNLSELGADTYLAGWVGEDKAGTGVKRILEKKSISTEAIISIKDHPTVVKTRILAGGQNQTVKQQILRIDQGKKPAREKKRLNYFKNDILSLLKKVDGVIFSDYGYGTIFPGLVREVNKFHEERGFVLAGDSRRNLGYYRNFDLLTPNEVEAGEFSGKESLEAMGEKVLKSLTPKALVITRGGEGMTLFEGGDRGKNIPPAGFSPVADVSGAGDTVISTLTMGRLGGASWLEGAYLAAFAAAIVVRKSGTATTTPEEIIALASDLEGEKNVN